MMTPYAKEWRQFRKEHKMSAQTLANHLGLALRTVQGIELGEHKPAPQSRMRFRALKKRLEGDPCQPLVQ